MNDTIFAGKAKFEKLLTACAVDAAGFHEIAVRLVEEYKAHGLAGAGVVDTVRHAEEIAGRLVEHVTLLSALVVTNPETADQDPVPWD